MPYLNALADFRDSVRKMSIADKSASSSKGILKECDTLRDDILPNLGVRLEDKENEATVIKLVDAEELAREKALKIEMENKKKAEIERKKKEAADKKAALEAAKRIPPQELFKQGEYAGKYSKYDDKVIQRKYSITYIGTYIE